MKIKRFWSLLRRRTRLGCEMAIFFLIPWVFGLSLWMFFRGLGFVGQVYWRAFHFHPVSERELFAVIGVFAFLFLALATIVPYLSAAIYLKGNKQRGIRLRSFRAWHLVRLRREATGRP